MEEIVIHIPGKPCAWQRARSNGKVRFDSAEQARNKLTIGQIGAAAMAGRPPFKGPLEVRIVAYFPWPKSMSEKKKKVFGAQYCMTQKDLDNICKLIGDSLNCIVWEDDRQIVDLSAAKRYSLTPETRIRVSVLVPDEESAP